MAKSRKGERQQPVTKKRIETYLRVLRETGSHEAAASAASPHCHGARPGGATFRELRRKDPEFALACEEALAEYVGALELAMARWSTNSTKRPVVSNGQVVGYEEKPPDPRLLLASLRRFKPEQWNEKRQLEVQGAIEHQHSGGVTMASIQAQDVMLLPPAERQQFAALLQRIVELRDAPTSVIEHDDG